MLLLLSYKYLKKTYFSIFRCHALSRTVHGGGRTLVGLTKILPPSATATVIYTASFHPLLTSAPHPISLGRRSTVVATRKDYALENYSQKNQLRTCLTYTSLINIPLSLSFTYVRLDLHTKFKILEHSPKGGGKLVIHITIGAGRSYHTKKWVCYKH